MNAALMPRSSADKNYFELFDLPSAFDLDLADLTERYRRLARQAHPDRYANGADLERRVALQTTAFINEAFQALKDPIARARYLLQLRGVDLGADNDTKMDPAFLAEQMELRERFEEARWHTHPKAGLAQLGAEVERRQQEITARLRTQLAPDAADSSQARDTLRELQFLDKLRRQIGDFEADRS